MDARIKIVENIKAAAQTGLVVTAGLVNDETDAEFIIIFNIKTNTTPLN
ncbi:MAG: hypothetical protein GY780_17050 [bacterium]|nr:hypothetical protein [bacterium]